MTTDWRKDYSLADETDLEHADRVASAEHKANEYFAAATAPQFQLWRDTISVIEPYRGSPRWARLRDQAKATFEKTTREAHELYEFTAEEIMRDGEVSEATSARWDALTASQIAQVAA